MKEVMMLAGAYQIGMMITRRTGYGKKIVIGDDRPGYAQAAAEVLGEEGFDAVGTDVDFSSRASVLKFSAKAEEQGEVFMFVGVSESFEIQEPVRRTRKSCQYGTAILLEEAGKVIRKGGAGVFITRQSHQKFCSADKEMKEQLAKKIMEEASRWEKRQARLNLISLADSVVLSEEKECSQVKDKIVDLAEFLICSKNSFITGADFLIFD